jgi:hypothetical protein
MESVMAGIVVRVGMFGWGAVAAGVVAASSAAAQVAKPEPAASAVMVERPWERRPLIEKTPCAGDAEEIGASGRDPDIAMPGDATVFVMMHGNRFVAARDLADAFERGNPGERVAYTAIPPVFTIKALEQGGLNVGAERMFRPDVVMAPPATTKILAEMKWKGDLLEDRGLYSRVHGFVLMARAEDGRVVGSDWQAILKDERLKLSLPGQQVPEFTSFGPLLETLGREGLEARIKAGKAGGTDVRHHRSMPARIAAGCEDVGIQFLQSRAFWQAQRPGVFKFVDVPIAASDAAKEDSKIFIVKATERRLAAQKFVAFVLSPAGQQILRKYRLER